VPKSHVAKDFINSWTRFPAEKSAWADFGQDMIGRKHSRLRRRISKNRRALVPPLNVVRNSGLFVPSLLRATWLRTEFVSGRKDGPKVVQIGQNSG
jgi:hypothetical protein